MIPLTRMLVIVGTTWYLGGYLFAILPGIYSRDVAFLGYLAALLIGLGAVDLVFASSVPGRAPTASDIRRNILCLCGGLLMAWCFGLRLGVLVYKQAPWLQPLPLLWVGWASGFLAGLLGSKILLSLGLSGKGGYRLGGGWHLILRPVKGRLFDAFLVMLPGVWFVRTMEAALTLTVMAVLFAIFTKGFPVLVYLYIGQGTAGLRHMVRRLGFGCGGGATFGGMLEEYANTWQPGEFLMGSSSYKKNLRLGVKDDRMLLTFSSVGGGKGRSAIIPNLLLWRFSALVIDPKGTNTAITYRARIKMGQKVYALDPFRQMRTQGVAIDTAFYNPLLDINPNAARFFEDIDALASALVVPADEAEMNFWDKKSLDYIAGFIEYVIDTEPPKTRTLMRVRELLIGQTPEEFETTLNDILVRGRPRGMAQDAAKDILRVMESPNTLNGVMTTVAGHLKWLGSPEMQKILSKSDFSMRDLQEKPTTVQVILPPEELITHCRFLRAFVAMGLRAVFRRGDTVDKKKIRVLFALDEFLALGRMELMIRAANVGRSYKLTVWPICQNIEGLLHVYGEKAAQTFIDSAGAIQLFSIGNLHSAEWLSNYLGLRDILRATPDGQFTVAGGVPLRTGLEVQAEVERGMEKQIILRSGKLPLYIHRYSYDKFFPKGSYDPDPDHRKGA
jgi:type IV secretory pathway TraG/TraD family ATPase VirD4